MKRKDVIFSIVIVILSAVTIHTCNRNSYLKDQSENTSVFLNDSIDYYKNKYGQEVAHKRALQGDKSALDVLLSKQIDSTGQLNKLIKKYKNVAAAGNITTITQIDSIPLPYEVPVPYVFEREWEKSEPFYYISGRSTHLGNTIDSLKIPIKISFGIGDKKIGLFNSEYRFEATSDNPYTKITGLDGYTHKSSESILSLGAQAGYGFTNSGLSPYVGGGITIDLWVLIKSILK